MEPERMIESQAVERMCWLRGAVLLANGGMLAIAGLVAGMAAAAGGEAEVLLAGVIGLVAGAAAVAAVEFNAAAVRAEGARRASLSRDGETADMDRAEITAIYRRRGLSPELAEEVALSLTMVETGRPAPEPTRPIEAGLGSATLFGAGAAVPLAVASAFPLEQMGLAATLAAIGVGGCLAALCARNGGGSVGRAVARVAIWGALVATAAHVAGSLLGSALA